jgi:hypothetical protein
MTVTRTLGRRHGLNGHEERLYIDDFMYVLAQCARLRAYITALEANGFISCFDLQRSWIVTSLVPDKLLDLCVDRERELHD